MDRIPETGVDFKSLEQWCQDERINFFPKPIDKSKTTKKPVKFLGFCRFFAYGVLHNM
jgi:hypothetical protein